MVVAVTSGRHATLCPTHYFTIIRANLLPREKGTDIWRVEPRSPALGEEVPVSLRRPRDSGMPSAYRLLCEKEKGVARAALHSDTVDIASSDQFKLGILQETLKAERVGHLRCSE